MGDDLTDLQIQERDIARIAGQILPCYEDIFGADCTVEKLYFSENRTCLVRDRGHQRWQPARESGCAGCGRTRG